ncbi:MAG TPA: dihydrolipoamide acetyltransferase family protein [Thermoleophilaceae bacterium]|jgi:2-oxoglutarate dehydrogenase E2 component (dihydrolipoamide succinyltransferase)
MSDTVPIPMPHLGVSVTEGTVLEWHKAEGDAVRADELVCEVSTDKVDTEVLAPADGVLARIIAAPGETVAVGEPLAELRVGVEAPAAAAASPPYRPARREPAAVGPRRFDPVAAAEAVVPRRTDGAACSPVARRIAAEHGVDLHAVRGSGIRGRIRKADVLAAIEGGAAAPAAPAPAPAAAGLPRGYDDVPHEVVELSRQRSLMAEHMIRSRQTAAHMTTEAEVDMSAVDRAREELSAPRVADGGRRLTALPFITRATCAALLEFPDLNATFDGSRLIRWREVNMGIAVDTEQGLIVPVIRGCDGLPAPAIGDAIAELAALARSRRLTPDHVRAGTFTISNPGSVGGISAMAIINQPQVGILGTPAVVRRPLVVPDGAGGEAIAIRSVMTLALTFDHRVIDGAYATRCVVRIKELLETWPASSYA